MVVFALLLSVTLWAGEGDVHANLAPFGAFLCQSLLDGEIGPNLEIPKGDVVPVTVTHLSSYKGDAPTFAVMTKEGSTFNYVPAHALLLDKDATPMTLAQTTYQNAPGEHVAVSRIAEYAYRNAWVYLRQHDGSRGSEPLPGRYLFSIDWPSENVLLHAIQMKSGHLVLYPPSKVQFANEKPTEPLPHWKKLRATWVVGKQARSEVSPIPFQDILAQTQFDDFPASGTKVVPVNAEYLESHAMKQMLWTRLMPEDEFVRHYASGTLRKNAALGFVAGVQRAHERVPFEFGYGFESQYASTITLGRPMTEGDTHSLTELGWHLLRAVTRNPYPGDDVYQVAYLSITAPDGTKREGAGIILRQTSFPFVPKGHLVFALVAEFDATKNEWLPTVTP